MNRIYTYNLYHRYYFIKSNNNTVIIEDSDKLFRLYQNKYLLKYEREYFEKLFITYSFWNDTDNALLIGSEYNRHFPSYELTCQLANLHLEEKDTFQFLHLSLEANYYIPSKIQAKFQLFQFYNEKKDTLNAKKWAYDIIFGLNMKQHSKIGKEYILKATQFFNK